jgi:hypothetical protein
VALNLASLTWLAVRLQARPIIMEKLKDYFDTIVDNFTSSIQENLPAHIDEQLKFNVSLTHPSGHVFNFGLLRCPDGHGGWKWCRC